MRILPAVPSAFDTIGLISNQDPSTTEGKYEFVDANSRLNLENAKKSFQAGLKAINERLEFLSIPTVGSLWCDKNDPRYYVRVVDISQGMVVYVKHSVADDRILESYARDISWFKSSYSTEYPKPCDC